MNSPSTAVAKDKMREAKPWVRRFGRFGYMAKGLVYLMIGVLAALAAFGPGGETTGTSGALQSIAEIPFGEVALWIIGIGLIGYILWDFILALKDPENEGTDAKGLIKRTGYFISGLIYSNLAFGAIKLASHTGNAGGENSEKTISAKLMEQPFGEWLVGLVGAIIMGYGVYELYKGIKEKFMSKFKTYEMNEKERKIARLSGKIGLISRGIVLSMVGFFFIRTAYTNNPNESKGLGGALTELANQPFGQFLLAIVAVGLILYGVYQIIRGRYQHMNFGYDGR
jgi:Mn2+/Fe2+ NRAMP family transporter